MKFIITKTNAIKTKYADIIGISTNWTAWMNKNPIPGHWKTVSVIIENAIKVPIFIPAIVITGINPFFNACL